MDKATIKASVEAAWHSRAKAQGLKPGTAKYLDREIEFFTGAMAALQAVDPNAKGDKLTSLAPVSWTVNAMTGRPIAS